jgi:hypothetical protein
MKNASLLVLVLAVYALHQDIWFWRSAEPLLFGVLPAGLWYHAGYTLAAALLMWLLSRVVWPAHLEQDAGTQRSSR